MKKLWKIIAIIIVLALLLTPIRIYLKDGRTACYAAILYQVTKIHSLKMEYDSANPYIEGFEVRILGIPIYREIYE